MMSVLEYAQDVSLSVEVILKLCDKLAIEAKNEDDMLDDEAIIMLDNEIENGDYNSDEDESNYDGDNLEGEEIEINISNNGKTSKIGNKKN